MPRPTPRRRVLLVTYYFPPAGGPASLRLLSFARHLPLFGFDPVVLTVRAGDHPQRDDSLLGRLPDSVTVYRTVAPGPHGLYRALTGREKAAPIPAGVLSGKPESLVDALLRWTRRNVLVPDARIGWVPFCAAAARRIAERERIDCVLTSSPPHSLQIAGMLIRRWTGLPWVADLRDPWTRIEYYGTGGGAARRSRLASALDARLERSVLRRADRVVTTSEDLAETLSRAHGADVAAKIAVVRNGVDPDDAAGREADAAAPAGAKLRITHVGQLPASRSPRTYFAAIRAALDARPDMAGRLELLFVGSVDAAVRGEIEGAGLLPFARFEPFLPHAEALALLRGSAALLAPLPETGGRPDIVPAKIFEYIAARRPILAAAPRESEVARLVASGTGAAPVEPGDVAGALERLLQIDAAFVDGRKEDWPKLPSSLDRRDLARRLAATLSSACERGGSGAAPEEPPREMATREHTPTGDLKEVLRAAAAAPRDARSPSRDERGLVSIVVPVHEEAENVPIAHAEIARAIEAARIDAEIVYVDDGSRDGTPGALEAIFERDARVTVVTLRRRFGKSAALDAGFRRARGARIVTIDGDLQYDAADMARLLARLGPDCDMAIGWRRTRALSPWKRLLNAVFNAACRRAARQRAHDFNCGLRAFRREVADEIEIYGELHRYFPVFASWRGFRIAEVEIASRPRRHGKSKFGASRVVKAFFDFMAVGMLTRFSRSPLHVFGLLGVLLTALGFLVNGYLSLLWCFGSPIGSRPLLLFGVLLMIIGIQTTFFGLLAELIVNARRGEGEYAIEAVLAHREEGAPRGAGTAAPGSASGDEREETVHA